MGKESYFEYDGDNKIKNTYTRTGKTPFLYWDGPSFWCDTDTQVSST